jgi:IrrE N-terminal-like domain
MKQDQLLEKLKFDYPDVKFVPANTFYWSSRDRTIFYDPSDTTIRALWATLHELSHCLLGHKNYASDFELLLLEREAWSKAESIASKYKLPIDQEHIEDCLDTYRDWLNKRSSCPNCGVVAAQIDNVTYCCHLCGQEWLVTSKKQCRPYRLSVKQTNKTSAKIAPALLKNKSS